MRHSRSRLIALRVIPYLIVFAALSSCARAQQPTAPVGAGAAYTPVVMDAAELFNYDKSVPLTVEQEAPQPAQSFTATKMSYLSSNNQRVPAIFVLPTGQEGKKLPCIMLMHGLGQNKTTLALLWANFARAGYALLSIDAQYHGDRAPKVPLDVFGVDMYSTRDMLIQTVVDLRRGVDFLQSRPEIDPNRIGYVGFSMGGIMGAIFTAIDNRIQAPVLALAGGNWRLMFQNSSLPAAVNARKSASAETMAKFAAMDPIDPIRWVGRISPRPLLFINGDADTTVPVVSGKALQDAAGPGKEIFIYKGEHVPKGTEFFRVFAKINAWCDSHLKEAAH